MHLTEIVLKNGEKISGIIERQRFDKDIFEHSYIKLFDSELIYLKNIKSAITKSERVSVSKIGDVNEIAHMRKIWQDYKKGRIEGISLVEPEYRISRESD